MNSLSKSQQKKIYDIAVCGLWRGDRMLVRRLFDALDCDGQWPRGYSHKLEMALKVANRARAALAALEQEDV